MKRSRNLFHPEVFQGKGQTHPYFEGWYLKHLSADCAHHLVVIPGIVLSEDDPHAFIQLICGTPVRSYYLRFDLDSFQSSDETFQTTIGSNTFSAEGIHLDIEDGELSLQADLHYADLTPIRQTLLTPNIMGFFAYLPFMQCYHGLISLEHGLQGEMVLNGQSVSFNGGSGYMEKDWGQSFPKKYIWLQCNQFDSDITLFVSVAHIPFLGRFFTGCIAVLTIDGREYRFATYNGANHDVTWDSDGVLRIHLQRKSLTLQILATPDETNTLKAPRSGGMVGTVLETLSAGLRLQVQQDGDCLLDTSSACAAMEIYNYQK